MDPLHLAIALGPVSVYFLILGLLNLSSRPTLLSGSQDTAALAVAVSGFVIAGPMELFMPLGAAIHFGPLVWVLLIGLYTFSVALIVLMMRPRLVVYNVTPEALRRILKDLAAKLDDDLHWAGDSLALPSLGVQLHLEANAPLRNVQLVSAGPRQDLRGWSHLEQALGVALRQQAQTRPTLYGGMLAVSGAIMALMVAFQLFSDQEGVATALQEMLQR